MASTATDASTTPVVHGMVKWFDQRKGFGFITVVDGSDEYHQKDVFVHHTDVVVQKARYKNLFQGEYVSFFLEQTGEENHPVKATNVMGAFRGLLQADTRVVRNTGRVGGRGRGRGRGGVQRGRGGRSSGPGRRGPRRNPPRQHHEEPIDLTPNEQDGDAEFSVSE